MMSCTSLSRAGEFYARKFSGEAILTRAILAPDTDFTKLREAQRQYWIAFKHATEQGNRDEEREDDELLKRFTVATA
jgi:hypothetical protein